MRKSSTASISDVANTTFRKGDAVPSSIGSNSAEKMTPVTLRLGQADFRRLRMFGAERGLKHQTILLEALMRYLDAEEGSHS